MANDTICALATPAGGAIGIIRISGSLAINITDSIFRPANVCRKKDGNESTTAGHLKKARTQTIHYGTITDSEGNIIDDVLVALFRAPHSYTGEDSTEISCHGSRYILNKVLQLLIDAGCRQAQPGEYTQRAFLNGKMDLSQAEAVADLIAATNSATHRIAIGQLRGNISTELSQLRDRLLKMTSLIELELDFSDHEELEFADRTELLSLSNTISQHINNLTSTFASGHAIKQGIPVAIVGKTNVGKSTLLNLLVGEDKAIVSNIHGTTRDVIEDTTDINGVTFRFVDTAGLRTTDDEIERIGIERTYRKLNDATIVLWIVDSIPSHEECRDIISRCHNKKLIVVNNKTDITDITTQLSKLFYCITQSYITDSNEENRTYLSSNYNTEITDTKTKTTIPSSDIEIIGISAATGNNTETLRNTIYRLADIPAIHENDVILTSARHYNSLILAHKSIIRVIDGLNLGLSGDLLSEDLRICIEHLAEITGNQINTNEVLANIFKHFCVGK